MFENGEKAGLLKHKLEAVAFNGRETLLIYQSLFLVKSLTIEQGITVESSCKKGHQQILYQVMLGEP
jgi:hypothetical protein